MKHLPQCFGIITHRKGFVVGEIFQRLKDAEEVTVIWKQGQFVKGRFDSEGKMIRKMRDKYPDLPILSFDESFLEPGV